MSSGANLSPRPLISVIIPVYNSAEKLSLTLNSLAAQNSWIWEAIVRDGSPDSSLSKDVVDRFLCTNPKALVTRMAGPDKGVYDAINLGIAASVGDYINVLGTGDSICENVFTQIEKTLRDSYQDGRPIVIYGKTRRSDTFEIEGYRFTWADFARKRNICHQSMFFSRAVFDTFGLYDLRYPIRADNVLNIRLWADRRVLRNHLTIPISIFEGGGLSDTSTDQPFYEDLPGIIAKHFGFKGAILSSMLDMNQKLRAVVSRNLSRK